MIRGVVLVVLVLSFMCLALTDADAVKNGNAKWALHYAGPHSPSANDCTFLVGDCMCEVVVNGPATAGRYDIYVLALDTAGMAGTRYGISCSNPGSFYFYGWTSCCDLWLPSGYIWPAHGEGVMQAWPFEHPEPHVTLGILDVYVAAHTSPTLSVCDDSWVGYAEMCDGTSPTPICITRTVAGTPAAFGSLSFGPTGAYNTSGGYNPCGIVPTENMSWGVLKAQYR